MQVVLRAELDAVCLRMVVTGRIEGVQKGDAQPENAYGL